MKKTVRWTVFSREVRSGYAARTDNARQSRSGIIPSGGPKKRHSHIRECLFFNIDREEEVSLFLFSALRLQGDLLQQRFLFAHLKGGCIFALFQDFRDLKYPLKHEYQRFRIDT